VHINNTCASVATYFLKQREVIKRGCETPASTALLCNTSQESRWPSAESDAKKYLFCGGIPQTARVFTRSCIALPISGVMRIGTRRFLFPGTCTRSILFIRSLSIGLKLFNNSLLLVSHHLDSTSTAAVADSTSTAAVADSTSTAAVADSTSTAAVADKDRNGDTSHTCKKSHNTVSMANRSGHYVFHLFVAPQ